MPNEPYTTTLDEDVLDGFLETLDNPYAKDHNDLVQMQEAVDEPLRTIVHSLLDIPNHIQPLFPLQNLLTETRGQHLTCQQAMAASTYFRLLILEANVFWVLAVHYLVRAHVLDPSAVKLPANRAEALTLSDIPKSPIDAKHGLDPFEQIQIDFLVGAHQSPKQILENGPDFTLRIEDGDVVLRVVFREEPPAFIFSKAMQDPETGEITDPKAWEKISTQQLADVPGLAKRFRRHHQQDIRRAHTFIWPHDFLPLMTTLDDLQDPDEYTLMDPSCQDYLARQAALDLPQNRQGLRHIARDIRNPCHELARTIDTLPESETIFPIGDYLDRNPTDFSRFETGDPKRVLKPEEIIDDMTYALIEYNHFLQTHAFDIWLHYLNVYVLDAVHERPQPHLDKETLTTQARDKNDVKALDVFERGPDFKTTYDEEGALLIVTESLYLDTDTTDVWNHFTVREVDEKNITFEDEHEPFAYHFTWPAEVLDPLRPW